MKSIIRSVAINSFALWATSQIITGFKIAGGFETIVFGGITLALMNLLVKPVLSVLTLPLTLLTMGLFSWVLNVVLVYLLTVVVSSIAITSYTFPGVSTNGFSLPRLELSALQTTVLVAFVLSTISQILFWLFKR